MRRPRPHALAPLRALALGLSFLLAGCGGGWSVGVGLGDGCCSSDERPSVSLDASADSAEPGEIVRLSARADDDYGVVGVTLYQVVGSGSLEVGSLRSRPYVWDVEVPVGNGDLEFYAVARDGAGQQGASASVLIRILP